MRVLLIIVFSVLAIVAVAAYAALRHAEQPTVPAYCSTYQHPDPTQQQILHAAGCP